MHLREGFSYILCRLILQTFATNCELDIDAIVSKEVALQHHTFWSANTTDVIDCARTCVKRKQCKSFNFDTGARRCELNDDVHDKSKTFRLGPSLIYSNIANWPSQLEPNCFARPCGEKEVCIPGYLAGNTECSYSCLDLTPVEVTWVQPAVPDPAETPADCPNGWSKHGESCFFFEKASFNWTDASVYCEGKGAKLAEPVDSSANEFIKNTLRTLETMNWWFGLNDQVVEDRWVWKTDGKLPTYSDWKNGNPNAGLSANCGALWHPYGYGWVDEACSRSYSVICEKSL